MSKRINIKIDDQEERILNILIKRYGGRPPQIFRDALKFKFDKVFPNYAAIKEAKEIIPDEELTPEQICEQHGGQVKTINGIRVCERRLSPSTIETEPLGDPDILKWKNK
jgi:hypothetical protein